MNMTSSLPRTVGPEPVAKADMRLSNRGRRLLSLVHHLLHAAACGIAASHIYEVSITVIRRSEVAAMQQAERKERERPPEAPDLSEAELSVLMAIDRDEPTSEAEISRRTGYKRGRNLRRILNRLLDEHDIIARRAKFRYVRIDSLE